jgi:uncharacterized phage protein gp47/JayE
MYESMTYDVIMQQMLDRVPDTFDKREGSIIYDALAPAAAELAQLYIELDVVLNQTFADTATDEYLEKRCAERGINRTAATYAVVQGEFAPTTIDVIGQRFSCGNYNYTVTEETDVAGIYQLTCETSGDAPNAVSGQLIPINYISGLETASITEILIPGEDAESDDSLRERYFDSISSQAFGGNVADYEAKTKAIDGVGGVKVTPVWNGGGTVKLTIIASDYSIPSSTLIENVQAEMESIAPIGHVVTVDCVIGTTINIATDITYQDGWDWPSAGQYIESAIDEYFLSLAESWDDKTNLVVRISGIEQKILACAGVLDVQNTVLNDATGNIQLGEYEIPVRGDVSDGT